MTFLFGEMKSILFQTFEKALLWKPFGKTFGNNMKSLKIVYTLWQGLKESILNVGKLIHNCIYRFGWEKITLVGRLE